MSLKLIGGGAKQVLNQQIKLEFPQEDEISQLTRLHF